MRLMSVFRQNSAVFPSSEDQDPRPGMVALSEVAKDRDLSLELQIKNDAVRQDFCDLIEELRHVEMMREKFTTVVHRFVSNLDELEMLRTENADVKAAYAEERARVEELQRVAAKVEPDLVLLKEAKTGLLAQVQLLSNRVVMLEGDVLRERAERRSLDERLSLRESELGIAQAKLAEFDDVRADERSEIDRLTALLDRQEIELGRAESALQHSEEQRRLLKAVLDEATNQNARLSRQVIELEPSIDHYKMQIVELQSSIEKEKLAKEQVSSDRIEGLELLREELGSATAKVSAAVARAELHERMLAESRQNYREKLEELRASERRSIDLTLQLSNTQRKLEALEKESETMRSKLVQLEQERGRYSAQLEALSTLISQKEAEIKMANDRTVFVSARLEESQRSAKAERDRHDADLSLMRRLFDDEKPAPPVELGRHQLAQHGANADTSQGLAERPALPKASDGLLAFDSRTELAGCEHLSRSGGERSPDPVLAVIEGFGRAGRLDKSANPSLTKPRYEGQVDDDASRIANIVRVAQA